MTDKSNLPDNCYTDTKYPNDAICLGKITSNLDCTNITKKVDDQIINLYYTKKDNNWTCNTTVGNCNIDQCKNILIKSKTFKALRK